MTAIATQEFEFALRERDSITELMPLHLSDLTVDDGGTIHYRPDGSGLLEANAKAHREFLQLIGMPTGLWGRLESRTDERTRLANVLCDMQEDNHSQPVAVQDESGDKKVVGWSSPDRPAIPMLEAYTIARDRIKKHDSKLELHGSGGAPTSDTYIDETSATMSWSLPNLTVQPKKRVGDVTRGGIRMRIFQHGIADPQVWHYAHRLVCSNGMTLPEFRPIQVHGEGGSIADLSKLLEDAIDDAIKEVDKLLLQPFAESVDHEVHDPMAAARAIAHERGLGTRLSRFFFISVQDEIEAQRENWTMYDLINILTALQHNERVRQHQRFALQAAGGEASVHSHVTCTTCHREL